jgi:hypothetical protein
VNFSEDGGVFERWLAGLGQGCAGALNGPVHGGACHAEEVGDFRRGLRTLAIDTHEVFLLCRAEFGLFAPESSFGFRNSHALPGAGADPPAGRISRYSLWLSSKRMEG